MGRNPRGHDPSAYDAEREKVRKRRLLAAPPSAKQGLVASTTPNLMEGHARTTPIVGPEHSAESTVPQVSLDSPQTGAKTPSQHGRGALTKHPQPRGQKRGSEGSYITVQAADGNPFRIRFEIVENANTPGIMAPYVGRLGLQLQRNGGYPMTTFEHPSLGLLMLVGTVNLTLVSKKPKSIACHVWSTQSGKPKCGIFFSTGSIPEHMIHRGRLCSIFVLHLDSWHIG